jgi:small subunit ribosomal protein S14
MAKKSKVIKNNKRIALSTKFAAKRKALMATIRTAEFDSPERYSAMKKLAKMPRDTNPIRIRNRCSLTGRPRGVYSKFGLCRIELRGRAMKGELPGVTKSSW